MPTHRPIEQRLERLSAPAAGGCREWRGTKDRCGYGKVNWGKETLAHRAAYKVHVGAIPDGYEIDHLCKNRACINPDHLDCVPHTENVARADYQTNHRNKTKTHCKRGHAFTEANIIWEKSKTGIARKCRRCKSDRMKRVRRTAQ